MQAILDGQSRNRLQDWFTKKAPVLYEVGPSNHTRVEELRGEYKAGPRVNPLCKCGEVGFHAGTESVEGRGDKEAERSRQSQAQLFD